MLTLTSLTGVTEFKNKINIVIIVGLRGHGDLSDHRGLCGVNGVKEDSRNALHGGKQCNNCLAFGTS